MGSAKEAQSGQSPKKYTPLEILCSHNVDLGGRDGWVTLQQNHSIINGLVVPLKLSALSDPGPNHFVQLTIAEWRFETRLAKYFINADQRAEGGEPLNIARARIQEIEEVRSILANIRAARKTIGDRILPEEQEKYVKAIKKALNASGAKAKKERQALVVELKGKFFPPGTEPEEEEVPSSPPKSRPVRRRLQEEREQPATKTELARAKKELVPLLEENKTFLSELAFAARETALAVYNYTDGEKEKRLYTSHDHYALLRELQPDSLPVIGFHIDEYLSGRRGSQQRTERVKYILVTQGPQLEEHRLDSDGFASSSWVGSNDGFSAFIAGTYNTTDELKKDYALVHMGDMVRGLVVAGLLNGMAAECGITERIVPLDSTGELWEKWKSYADPQLIEKYQAQLNKLKEFFIGEDGQVPSIFENA